MAWKDFVTGKTNRIVVGSASAVGIIIAAAAGISLLTPAQQVKDDDAQVTWEVLLNGNTRQSGSVVTRGAIASSLLANCDTIDGTSTGMLVCGTDDSGAGATPPEVGTESFTGGVIRVGDTRFVKKQGDTMTGKLTIDLTAGLVGLNVVELASGAIVHGHKTLSTSGTLVFEGAASGASIYVGSVDGAGLSDCDGATQTLGWDDTSNRFTCGTDANTTYTAGVGLTLATTEFQLSHLGLESLTDPGADRILFWDESAGASEWLTVGTNLSISDTTISATDTNTTYTAGQGLGLTSTAFSLNTTITGSLVEFTTVSGATVYASRSLASSGSLVVEGTVTFDTDLTVPNGGTGFGTCTDGGFITGNGTNALTCNAVMADDEIYIGDGTTEPTAHTLAECSDAGDTLNYDPATNSFTCGTDADTTYSAGEGLVLTSTSFSLANTISGTLLEFQTVSGSLVWGNTVSSSGSLVWEGTATGNSLYVAQSLTGLGLTDCDGDSQTLAWNADDGRFSCGDDDNSSGTPEVGTSSFSGGVLRIGDSRYVTTSGDTMTGALVINVTGGTRDTLGLRIINTASGAHIHAEQLLTASGAAVIEGTITGGDFVCLSAGCISATELGTDSVASDEIAADQVGASEVANDSLDFAELQDTLDLDAAVVLNSAGFTFTGNADGNAAGDFIWAGDSDASLLFVDASADRVGIGTSTPESKFEVAGTISGSSVISLTAVSPLHLSAQWTESGSSVTTGTGKVIFQVPVTASGYNVVGGYVTFRTAGTTNPTRFSLINLDKGNRHIFTTPISVDSGETSSLTAASAFAVNATNDDVGGGDRLSFNVNSVSTTAPKGGTVVFILRKP